MSPLPQSVRDLTRNRPFLRGTSPSPYPLRCADGRTFAQRKMDQAA
jgi:hypothetical protein